MRRVLSRLPVDIVATGDYQPAENKFGISRRMLEVCLELGFPVSVLERSLLVLRDLDLLKEINQRALNKRVVETLANEAYWMELRGEPQQRIWAYRKAAWAVEDTEQDLALIYRYLGRKGLGSIENVGPKMAGVIEELIEEVVADP